MITAFAWPPTFGSEFNFMSAQLFFVWHERKKINKDFGDIPDGSEHKKKEELANAIYNKCKPFCTMTAQKGKFKGFQKYLIEFQDGFKFVIDMDPAVVEINTDPWTYEQIANNTARIQNIIFDTSKSIQLQTEPVSFLKNSAHFNIGVRSAFGDDTEKFLRFLVDYWSRPELASGVLGNDLVNAPL